MSLLSESPTLSDYIINAQVDGILWKAEKLLANIDTPLLRNERAVEIAGTIAKMPQTRQVVKDDYILKICKEYNINRRTMEKLVADQTTIERKKSDIKRVKKNEVSKLNGEARTFPFFIEKTGESKKEGRYFKGVEIDKLKYVQLLTSFGFTRYPLGKDFIYVQLIDNVIKQVDIKQVIDYFEQFVKKTYDFEAAGCEFVDVDILMKEIYDSIKELSNDTLLSRVRTENPIIINQDTKEECFLYYRNGFVRITKDGCTLRPYSEMPGSVWQQQMLDRDFKLHPVEFYSNENATDETPGLEKYDWAQTFSDSERPLGIFADFVWRLSGEKPQRLMALCSILGYMVHDFYDYKLKMPLFTDSVVSEKNEGRTGKTTLLKLLGLVRSYAEVNGKQFNAEDERKYQLADQTTQIIHLNDVMHFGRNKFVLEAVYPDITEGVSIRKMYQEPFVKKVKIAVSTNKSLQVEGSSARDRVIEYEVSSFFSETRSPLQYYGSWLGGKDWNEKEWSLFDNFICFCSQVFLEHGLIQPDTINLEARKLLDGTCREFVDFMSDIVTSITSNGVPWDGYQDDGKGFERIHKLTEFEFDKKRLYEKFLSLYPDWKTNQMNQKRFTMWLHRYSSLLLHVKDPQERRSNGVFFIKFKSATQTN